MFPTFGLDKIAAQLLGIVLCLGTLIAGYYWWVGSIKRDAMREWNNKQIEIVKQENEKYVKQLTEVNQNQEKTIQDLKKQNDDLAKRFESLDRHLNSPIIIKKYKDKPTSDVLKRTFKELNQ
jgi:flagellar capping protein FliD